MRLSREELLGESGLSSRQLDELVDFGFLCPRDAAGRSHYDESDLALARDAAALISRGVEVRHLQALKRTVEREIDLLNDITTPIRQRASQLGSSIVDEELISVSMELHALRSSLLARAVSHYLGT